MTKRRGFTLIELLTVIAITSILLTLIVLPIFQSFTLTRQAQALADAQNKAKLLSERIAREVGDAVAVRGGARVPTTVNGVNLLVPASALVVTVPRVNADGSVLLPREEVEVAIPYAKMDLVQPAQRGDASRDAEGNITGYVDPVTGKVDPTLSTFKGQTVLPIGPGQTMTRYAIGLRDPLRSYNNPYEGLLMAKNGERDNLYVLYRFTLTPRRLLHVFLTGGGEDNRYVADPLLFDHTPESRIGQVELADGTRVPVGTVPRLDDPRFLVPNRLGDGTIVTTDPQARRIQALLRGYDPDAYHYYAGVPRGGSPPSVLQTEVSRYDMLETVYDRGSRRVQNRNGVPQMVPLAQFRPSRVSNEPAEGQSAVRLGEETDNGETIAPDVFNTKLGLWSNAVVRTWPVGWVGSNEALNAYLVGRGDVNNGLPGYPGGFSLYAYDPDGGADDVVAGVELFDVDLYDRTLSLGGRYPFSQAVLAADGRSGWLGNAEARRIFTPYYPDSARGRIVSSFPITEVGDPTAAPSSENPLNLPQALVGRQETPTNATDLTGDWFDPKFSGVNDRFNKVWDLWTKDTGDAFGIRGLDQSYVQRFVDLRVTPQGDGSNGPLRPELGFKVSIVPGSEIVEGPDQNPGPNYGQVVRYTRVQGPPGRNQYRINYTNLREPQNYANIGLSGALAGFDRDNYDPQNFASAIVQPQFKAGYVQFNSDPNDPLPGDDLATPTVEGVPIRISYRFQFTRAQSGPATTRVGLKTDVFAVDYDSRELMTILLSVRNYPQSNAPNAQNVTLKATAQVRNTIR